MIPQAFITEWSQYVPWQTNEQVEQDLIICRALVEIFSDEWLASSLAFRGGTALHKLYFNPQQRYSEDIDLVQVRAEPIKETIQRLQSVLAFLGEAYIKPRKDGIRLNYRFESEFPPTQLLRLKVETNTREHFAVLDFQKFPFVINSAWYVGKCDLTTYKLEELLATKLRALYQRKKGRDLFDLYIAMIQKPDLDKDLLLKIYKEYMTFSVKYPPTRNEFILNMKVKMKEQEFLGDITGLLRPQIPYNPQDAYEIVRTELIERI